MRKSFLLLFLGISVSLFTNCSSEDDSDSTDSKTVSELLLGRWYVTEAVYGGGERNYFENPCDYYEFFAKERLQVKDCFPLEVSEGTYTVLDENSLELIDYNEYGDDTIATILEISEKRLVLEWIVPMGRNELVYEKE